MIALLVGWVIASVIVGLGIARWFKYQRDVDER